MMSRSSSTTTSSTEPRHASLFGKKTRLATEASDEEKEEKDVLWKPDFVKSHIHLAYVNKAKLKGTGIFGYIQINNVDAHHNLSVLCHACAKVIKGSVSRFKNHFASCDFGKVPEEQQARLKEYLKAEGNRFQESIEKPKTATAEELRKIPMSETTVVKSLLAKGFVQDGLAEATALYCLAQGEPAITAESPHFRALLHSASNGKLGDEDMRKLKRKHVSGLMVKRAQTIQESMGELWLSSSRNVGGTISIDGWTAARNINTLGVVLISLLVCFFTALAPSGTERSSALVYAKKIVEGTTAEQFALLFFLCSDGASNMVLLGDILKTNSGIQPILCAAHGFSLMSHYVAKGFEAVHKQMFARLGGIVTYFSRSPARLSILYKENSGQELNFLKFCPTRFAYQTLAILRMFRLRGAAQKAVITLKQSSDGKSEDDDSMASLREVTKALNDDTLWDAAEHFVRATIPILVAMRQFDRGLPMAGFVFWTHAQVEEQVQTRLNEMVAKDSSRLGLAQSIMASLRLLWDKRHRPVLSLAYLTNPLFHKEFSAIEGSPFDLADHFADDVEESLICFFRRKYNAEANDDRVIRDVVKAQCELLMYFQMKLSAVQETQAMMMLASTWWSLNASKFPTLAYCAIRVHSAAVVSSSLERFFSAANLITGLRRHSLSIKNQHLFTAAYLASNKGVELSPEHAQETIVWYVQTCQTIAATKNVADIDNDELDGVSTWLEGFSSAGGGLLYVEVESTEVETATTEQPQSIDYAVECIQDIVDYSQVRQGELLEEMDAALEDPNRRVSSRMRKAPVRLDL